MKSILLALSFLTIAGVHAQSGDQHIIATQGGHAKGKDISVSWTLGDLVTDASVTSTDLITQGFQQPIVTVRDITDVTVDKGNSNDPAITTRSTTLDAAVYPNPFGTDITVNVNNEEREYYIDVMDASGKLLLRNKVASPQEIINLRELPEAQYLLRITIAGSEESRIFQLIKSR
jgi:hypothetical protein